MRRPRSDRQGYGVYVRRGYWHGWYYDIAGKRRSNVPLVEQVEGAPLPTRIPVTRPDADRCPNRNKALDAIKKVWEGSKSPARRCVTLIAAIELWKQSLLLDGRVEQTTKERYDLLRATLNGVKLRGPVPKGETRPIQAEGTGWRNFQDINKHDMRQFLYRLAQLGRAAATRNAYLEVWRNFLDWCVGDDILQENPLGTLRKAKQDSPSYDRRPFSRHEFHRITTEGPEQDRLFYLTLGLSGLRYTEGRQLRKHHLDPLAARPMWRLPAKIQKVKLPETIPMSPQLAQAIADHWASVPEQGLIFPAPPRRPALYAALGELGIAKVNEAGEHLSMHSFRYFFATEMAKRLPMRKVQLLMRHKSIQLTADLYAKLHLVDVDDQWDVPEINF